MDPASGREEPREGPAETQAASKEGSAEDAEGKASGEKGQEEGRRRLRSLTGRAWLKPALRPGRAFALTPGSAASARRARPSAGECSSESPRRTRRPG